MTAAPPPPARAVPARRLPRRRPGLSRGRILAGGTRATGGAEYRLHSRCIPAKLMSMDTPSPKQLAEEALRALAEAPPMTPQEHWEFLVEKGIIDRNGRVLVNRLFGDPDAEQTDETAGIPQEKWT